MTFYHYAKSFPPILCRLLATNPNGPMTSREISDIARPGKPSVGWVEMLSETTSWEFVALRDMANFTVGCGIDFCNAQQMRRKLDYLRRQPTLDYLRKSTDWKDYYLPLLVRWRVSISDTDLLHPYVRALAVRLTPITKV